MKNRVVAFASMLVLGACGHPDVELPGDQLSRWDGIGPSWSDPIYSIMQDNCVTCHRLGQLATYKPLDTFEAASALADDIALRVVGPNPEEGLPQMPPYQPDATETCNPAHGYSNSIDLTDSEIADILAWVEAGAPHGHDENIPEPLAAPAVAGLTGATEYTFTEGTTVSIIDTSMYDAHRCIIYDPGVTKRPRRLSGLQLNPGIDHLFKGAKVVLDRYRESAQFVADDSPRDHGASWYDCDDGLGFEGELLTTFLAGTAPPAEGTEAPGGVLVPPFEMPPGTALSIPGDAVFVVKMLYHPHWDHLDPNITTEVTEELSWVDTTSLSVRWEARAAVLAPVQLFGFGNDEELYTDGTGLQTAPFEVPAGDPVIGVVPHTEIMTAKVPGRSTDSWAVWGVVPSMGKWGGTIEISSTPAAGGDAQCLGAISQWNVSFQSPIRYSEEFDGRPVVQGGDIVTVTCTYVSQSKTVLTLDEGPEQESCAATLGLVKL
jgi:hypothetical protein